MSPRPDGSTGTDATPPPRERPARSRPPGAERLDVLLVDRGLAPTREKAQAVIMAGLVRVDGRPASKPGTRYGPEAAIEVQGRSCPYVSRGGLKLARALERFRIDPTGWVCLDVGASTGGFTDCLLQNGARRVYAIDVGYGQLDASLRGDPRVVSHERVNARALGAEHVPEAVDFACVDVSFISLSKVLGPLVARLKPGGGVVALVKPQFEAGRRDVGRNGVVRDAAVHVRVLREAVGHAQVQGLRVRGLAESPIHGPAGNIEFLLVADLREDVPGWDEERAEREARRVVDEAHAPARGAASDEIPPGGSA